MLCLDVLWLGIAGNNESLLYLRRVKIASEPAAVSRIVGSVTCGFHLFADKSKLDALSSIPKLAMGGSIAQTQAQTQTQCLTAHCAVHVIVPVMLNPCLTRAMATLVVTSRNSSNAGTRWGGRWVQVEWTFTSPKLYVERSILLEPVRMGDGFVWRLCSACRM